MKKIKTTVTIVVTCIVTVIIIVLLGIASSKMKNVYYKEIITDNAEISFGKIIMKRGNISNYSLKGHKYGDEVTIESKLGKSSVKNPVLLFNNFIDAGVRVFIDDIMVYEYGMDAKKNSIVCNDNMVIPLLRDCSNKTIKVVFRCTNAGVFSKVPSIYYMNSEEAGKQSLIGNIMMQISGIMLINLGIVCITLFIFNIGINVTVKQIIYISIASISGGGWILSCYQVLSLFADSYVVDFYVEYVCIYVMLLFFNIYLEDLTKNEKDKKVLKIMQLLWCIYAVIAFILQICNVVHMNDSIVGLHIISLPTIVIFMRYFINKVKEEGKGYTIIYGTILIISVISVSYCVMHWLKTSISILGIVPIIVLIVVIVAIINSFIELKKAYSTQAEQDALIDLIYIDRLTGINNRRGLDRFDQEIRRNGIHYDYTVYSIDLNKLKYVNDTYGHSAGDKLIKAFADQVNKVVNANGFCGRMGGDEFVVVIREEDYNGQFETLLETEVGIYNTKSKDVFKLQYSIGASSYKIGGTATIDDVIRKADYNMYDMKTKYHRKAMKGIGK